MLTKRIEEKEEKKEDRDSLLTIEDDFLSCKNNITVSANLLVMRMNKARIPKEAIGVIQDFMTDLDKDWDMLDSIDQEWGLATFPSKNKLDIGKELIRRGKEIMDELERLVGNNGG